MQRKKAVKTRPRAGTARPSPTTAGYSGTPLPKGIPCDMNENDVRRAGLENELVDYKVAAIDATWAGLKFAHRKAQ